jgi:hypothetical protein
MNDGDEKLRYEVSRAISAGCGVALPIERRVEEVMALIARERRRAEAAEAEAERLRGELAKLQLTPGQVDQLLERWDQTEPRLQREITAKFAALYVAAQDRIAAQSELLARRARK